MANKLAPDTRYKTPRKPVKRWQVRDLGAPWQYAATPHPFLSNSHDQQVMLDLLDDATRPKTFRVAPGPKLSLLALRLEPANQRPRR